MSKHSMLINIQDGGCRHIELGKTVANSLLFHQASPNIWACCNPDIERIFPVGNWHVTWRNLGFRWRVVKSLLFDQSSLNLMRLVWIRCVAHLSYRKTHSDWSSSWRLLPFCILKNYCRSFDIRLFLTKFGGKVVNLIDNTYVMSKYLTWTTTQDGGFHHLRFG